MKIHITKYPAHEIRNQIAPSPCPLPQGARDKGRRPSRPIDCVITAVRTKFLKKIRKGWRGCLVKDWRGCFFKDGRGCLVLGWRGCLVLVLIVAGLLAPVSDYSIHSHHSAYSHHSDHSHYSARSRRAGRMRRVIGLKEAFALAGAGSERINRQDMIRFEGALYVHRSPYFGRVPGTLDGGSHYAIQSPDSLPAPLFALNNVEIKSSSGSGILGNLPRKDYHGLVSFLRNDERKRCLVAPHMENPTHGNINPMILAPYAQHGDYESEEVTVYRDVGGQKTTVGTYTYTMNGERVIREAALTVNENCSLDLPSGTYYLTALILGKNATLTGAGPVTVFCTGEVLLQPESRITGEGENPRNFSLLCSRSRFDKARLAIEIMDGCEFVGTILAPEWDLIIHQGVTLTGGIIVGFFMVRGTASQPWRIEFFDPLASSNPSSSLDMAVRRRDYEPVYSFPGLKE